MAHDDDEFEEYVEERPDPIRSSQRLLIIILSVGCLALGISNVVLATRVTQLRRTVVAERPSTAPAQAAERPTVAPPATPERPAVASSATAEPPAVAEPPVVASAPARERPSTLPPAPERRTLARTPAADRPETAERPVTGPPAAAASIASPPSPPEPHPAPAPEVAPAPAPDPAKLDLPPRARAREQARVAAVTRTTERSPAPPSSPERATASWMVQEYGRADAERRARAVADFYGAHSPDGAYWRRVLAEIAAARR